MVHVIKQRMVMKQYVNRNTTVTVRCLMFQHRPVRRSRSERFGTRRLGRSRTGSCGGLVLHRFPGGDMREWSIRLTAHTTSEPALRHHRFLFSRKVQTSSVSTVTAPPSKSEVSSTATDPPPAPPTRTHAETTVQATPPREGGIPRRSPPTPKAPFFKIFLISH